MSWREGYQRVVSPEAFLPAAEVIAWTAAIGPLEPVPGGADAIASEATRWRDERLAQHRGLLEPTETSRGAATRTLLVQSTPLASVVGAMLHGWSAPGVCEEPVQLAALAVLAADVGVGRPAGSRFDAFRRVLIEHELAAFAVPARELPSLRAIDDDMFAVPAMLLALARRADRFAPELCGIDLVLRSVGLLPAWAAIAEQAPGAAWQRVALGPAGAIRAIAAALGDAPRVAAGAAWGAAALARWDVALAARAARAADPELAMALLIADKARHGAAYHHGFELEGEPLSAWLARSTSDPLPLVRALARSKLVRPGDAANSPLVTGLVSPKGPMFRIFTDDELATMRRWIDLLPARRALSLDAPIVATSATHPRPEPREAPRPLPAPLDDEPGEAPRTLRDAYFVLQGRALAPRTRRFAVDYVQRWLVAARRGLARAPRSLPAAWAPGVLASWLADRHEEGARRFLASDPAAVPSRDDVIDETLQLAPLTLIDGAWLQGFTDVELASSRVGAPLFQIYWDELGNGQPALNHPAIYRGVLRQMGIELPPTGSRAFADDARLRETSFRLPVYWLCLGKLPLTFEPEILGLNLAMELAGVGEGYRHAHRFLAHHGFRTRFVELHNTIDNVAGGHAAWAADAIDTYLRRAPDGAWDRIRIGFVSLTTRPGPVRFIDGVRAWLTHGDAR